MGRVTKLFTVKSKGISLEDAEKGIFYIFDDTKTGGITYLDCKGRELDPDWEDDEIPDLTDKGPEAYMNDTTHVWYSLSEERYVFTTHEVIHDPDGDHGYFGIKDTNGNIVASEQFESVSVFRNGLCAVQNREDHKWGFIDRNGTLVIDFQYYNESDFNQYGVAVGNDHLIDRSGNDITGTELNGILEACYDSRYYIICLDTSEEHALPYFTQCDIFDTKNREYIAKRISCNINVDCDGENDKKVIQAAIEHLNDNTNVNVMEGGYFASTSDECTTVYKYED